MTGWQCAGCGRTVAYGVAHRCPEVARGVRRPVGLAGSPVTDAELLRRMRERALDQPGAIQRAGEQALAEMDDDRLAAVLRLPRPMLEDTGVIAATPSITVAWRWAWRPWRAFFRWDGTGYEAAGWTRTAARRDAIGLICTLERLAQHKEVRTYPDVPSHTRQ